MAKRIYRKKLTNSGGGVCVTAGFAALFACCAAAGDFIAAAVYGQFYTKQIYPIYPSFSGQLRNYGGAAVTAVFAVIMFIWALSAAKGKRLGREFGMMGVFMGAVFCLAPAEQLFSMLTGGFIDEHFGTGYDSDAFQGAMELARYGLPLLSGILLFLAGIAVLARLGAEDFVVEAPRADKRSKPVQSTGTRSDNDGFADPRSFGGGKTVVEQGLTGETKPATYNESSEDKPVHKERVIEEDEPPKEEKTTKKATVKLCPECGELVGEDELFCANCGHSL